LAAFLLLFGKAHVTVLLLPVVLLPLILLTQGLSWFLAALGVYVRDVTQVVGVLTSMLMFLTPIFYPLEILPKQFQFWLSFNPLTSVIGWVRDILMWNRIPDWQTFGLLTLSAFVVAWLGFAWFQKTRKGFADVL
jgi:lipopolysaccharide transport system permease protein